MTGRLGAGAAASLLVAAVLALACVVLTAGTAQAVPLPVQVSFDNLLPGEVRGTSWPVSVPVPARIAAAAVRQDDGVQWTARLCPTAGGACLDLLSATVGTTVAQGDYRVQVGVDATNLQPGQSRSFEARYTLAEAEAEDGWLADTGGALAMTGVPALAVGSVAVLTAAFGAVLVLLARRRRDDEPADTTGTEPPA